MADWRQIQARIRKAKASADAAAKLAELYEHTRDAMVAFELARWQEKAGEHAEAARWYTAAAERFRRSQWKTKAEAALARLRNPNAAPTEADGKTTAREISDSDRSEAGETPLAQDHAHTETHSSGEPSRTSERRRERDRETTEIESTVGAATVGAERSELRAAAENPAAEAGPAEHPADHGIRKKPRRRGRRGGRNRRRVNRAGADPANTGPQPTISNGRVEVASEAPAGALSPAVLPSNEPVSPVEQPPAALDRQSAAWRARSRSGEPALASRMAHLESQLRRLLASPQGKLEEAELAPAGPGVLLLSDSEQVTHYYVESCQTLRIAIGNLLRGGRGGKDTPQLKQRLAENLGIAESRVSNYLKEHCGVRWLQVDEGASELAHFAIAVLRPAVND